MPLVNQPLRWIACEEDTEILVEAQQHLKVRLIFFQSIQGLTRVKIRLVGVGASVDTQVLFLGGGQERFSIEVQHVHEAPETHSQLHARGAVAARAQGTFLGTIVMPPGCGSAKGTLKEHMLLLSPFAKIETIPALEIAHHDVMASHSASLERVDKEKLFYLTSRGLSEATALRLIVEGFFADGLATLPNADSLFEEVLAKLNSDFPSAP